jgi:hypothetical protein
MPEGEVDRVSQDGLRKFRMLKDTFENLPVGTKREKNTPGWIDGWMERLNASCQNPEAIFIL